MLFTNYILLVVLWDIIAKSVGAFVAKNETNQMFYLALVRA